MKRTHKIFAIAFPCALVAVFLLLKVLVGRKEYDVRPATRSYPAKTTFAGEKMIYYPESVLTSRVLKRYPSDTFSSILYELRVNDDGTTWLLNHRFDKESTKAYFSGEGNWVMVKLEASPSWRNGRRLRMLYDELIENPNYYGIAKTDDVYGLKHYIEYIKPKNTRTVNEYLLSMKDEKTPERLLCVYTPYNQKGTGIGGVEHYVMYNDKILVIIDYKKKYLKDWAHIEKTVLNYIHQRFMEAKK